uniref:Major facilitator superfamily (MFS) profile domain-containing protein n=1 Tax=Eutreptiella gymnastica TaxID=73025 RepID=A0A7S4GIG8_9EUGL
MGALFVCPCLQRGVFSVNKQGPKDNEDTANNQGPKDNEDAGSYWSTLGQYMVEQRSVGFSFFLDGCEWYVYPFVHPQIAAAVFNGNPQLTWLVWGSAFMTSILGSMVFGILADSLGRKASFLTASAVIIAGTLGQGLCPIIPVIGPVWMISFRCLQGVGYGGKFSVGQVHLAEKAPRSILAMSRLPILLPSACAMFLMSSMVMPMYHWLSPAQMLSWGWRVPFLVTSVLGPLPVLLFWVEMDSDVPEIEDQQWEQSGTQAQEGLKVGVPATLSLMEVMQEYWLHIAVCTSGMLMYNTYEGIGAPFMKAWLSRWCDFSHTKATLFITVSTVMLIPSTCGFLVLADTYGVCKIGLAGAVYGSCFSIPLFMPLFWHNDAVVWFVNSALFGLLLAARSTCVIWGVELFPREVRGRCYGISATIGMLLGSSAPVFCSEHSMLAGFYGAVACMMSACAMAFALVSNHHHNAGKPGWIQTAYLRNEPY